MTTYGQPAATPLAAAMVSGQQAGEATGRNGGRSMPMARRFAIAMGAIGIVVNAYYQWKIGTTVFDAALAATIGAIIDAMTITVPAYAKVQWHEGSRGSAVVIWIVWASALAPMTCLNTMGFTAQYFGDATAARAGTITQSSHAEDQRSQNIAIAQQAADAATEARKAECGNGDPKQRGKLCRGKEDAEQAALGKLATANAAPIEAAAPIASADPAADMINAVFHIPREWVQYARIGFTTLALIAAGLVI